MTKTCPVYKCGCSLPQCNPGQGICALQGTAAINTKEGSKMDCPKTQKECTSGACLKDGKCQGDVCPTDGEICALGKCVVHNKCHWHDYYGDMVPDADTRKAITSDPKLAPATKPVQATLPLATGTGTGSNWQSGGKTVVHSRDCHKGMIMLKGGDYNVELHLGGRLDWLNSFNRYDLTMHLTGGLILRNEPDVFEFNEAARTMLPTHLLPAPRGARLAIDWPDYGVPAIAPTWWERFIVWLASEAEGRDKDKPFKLAIHCEGGHGRTGTAAAIVAHKLGMVPDQECPVLWLRNVYCKEVVESDEQIVYIEKVLGITVTGEANSLFGGSWGYTGNYSGKGGTYKPYNHGAKGHTDLTAYSKPKVTVPAVVAPVMPKASEQIKSFDSAEAIRNAPGVSKTRRKKLMRLWERGQKKLLGK